MKSIILSLEAFGGGESMGCIGATLDLDAQKLDGLLKLADYFKAANPRPIRVVFYDASHPRWFVEDGVDDKIEDFTQEADGYSIIGQHPGPANLLVDEYSINLTDDGNLGVKFSWGAVVRETDLPIFTTGVPEAFLRELRNKL